MDELKKVIDLQPLSDESIKEHQYALSDLWMVKDEHNNVYGPYPTDSLRNYSHKYKYLFDNAKVYNLENEQWYAIFEVKHFQRRKPKLVSAQNLIADSEFYVLVSGQKNGPFTLQKMQQLLEQGNIMPSSQISLDNGESWIKLYEHHAFDRRNKKSNQELPFVPDNKIMDEVKPHLREGDEDELTELARLNQQGDDKTKTAVTTTLSRSGIRTKTQLMENPLLAEEEINEKIKQPENFEEERSYKVVFVSIALFLGLAFAGYFIFSNVSKTDVQRMMKSVKTESKGIDNSDRNAPKKATIRKPASVKKARKQTTRRVTPKRIQPKRYIPKPRRVVERVDNFDRDNEVEELDINDPEVQDELTRKLAGDYEEEDYNDEYSDEEPYEDDYPEEDRNEEDMQELYPEESEDDTPYNY